MDNKGSGTNLAFWLPGSTVILSLVVSIFGNTRNDAVLRQVQDDPRVGRDAQYRLALTPG